MSRADTRAQLAEYLRLNPDTSAIEAVGAVGADPSGWIDLVRDALAADTPHAVLDATADTDTSEHAEEDPTPDRSTPGVEADASGSATKKPTDGEGSNQQTDPEDGGLLVNADTPTIARRSGRSFYPATVRDDRSWWVDWVLALPLDDDGAVDTDATPTKQPIAPYRRGDATPVRWNFGLDDDDHPSTSFDTVERWNDARIGMDVHAPDRVISDTVGVGIIIPPEQDARTITLLDWDDVRDPDTEEVHPVAARALAECDGYAEVSQSGEGIHQFVFGEIPGGLKKFIRHIDDEPFIGDDLPQIEMYQSGRLCAMTGEHVAGSGEDVTDGQDLIDRLCWEYGTAGNTATDTPSDPFTTERDDDTEAGRTPDHDAVADAVRAASEYDGDDLDDWDVRKDRSLAYEAVLRARERSDDLAGVANWELLGYAAALGYRDGLDKETILDDLREHPTPQYGYDDARARKEIRGVFRKAEGGNYNPPTRETLIRRGILPEDAAETGEPTAVLPPSVRDLSTAASGWDWRHAGQDTDLTIDAVRDRTAEAIGDAYGSGDRVLIEALPTMGKSYGSVLAAAETGEPVTILTQRGHKEQYAQLREWCDEHGLTYKTLPSFTRDCETANGEHGQEEADRVRGWYNRGATPKAIHAFAEDVLGRPLPCQAQDGDRCTYAAKWDFDPETDGSVDPEEDEPIDVLIGHYAHAHKPKVTTGRTVVFDEFPGGAYETELKYDLQRAVSSWLDTVEAIPFESYTDLLENRSDESRRADALLWFDEHGTDPDETHVFDDKDAHATAPLAVFTLLAGEDLGNGYEHANLGDGTRAVFDRADGGVSILNPPDLDYASGVVALDGTPTKRMWELALGERLNHRPVLQPEERAEYVRDALNLNLVRTTEYIKPYNRREHIHAAEDAALLEAVAEQHGERPGVITSSTAENEYDDEGVLDLVDETKHYGNVLGSNEFKEKRVGAVIGSNHYGDKYVKKWGGYAGQGVERGEGKGTDLSYSGFGGDVLQHMREHDTLQAAMRFGRDGNGAVVYVHTNTLPDWVPVAAEGRVLNIWSDGMKQVVRALEDLGRATTADLVEYPAVDLTRQQVFDHLETLRERGVLQRQQDPDDGRRVLWSDGGLHRVNEHGDVELEPVGLEDLDDDEVRQVERNSLIYTWDLTNPPAGDATDPVAPPVDPSATPTEAVGAADTPPDPGD